MLLRLKLKDLYAEKGLTQKRVSEETGIRASTLSGLANNLRTSWDVDILERFILNWMTLVKWLNFGPHVMFRSIFKHLINKMNKTSIFYVCHIRT